MVRRHHKNTVAYLLADHSPCTTLRDEEIERINRKLVPIESGDLADLNPSGSWFLAVVLCPGDDLQPLARWTVPLPKGDRDRIRFYAHPEADLVKALEPWYNAGLEDPLMEIVHDWRSLHPPFGRDLNDRVYRDASVKGNP